MTPEVRVRNDEARSRAERAARALVRDPRVRLVFLFGSAADPNRTEVRDVDLAVLTDPPLTLDDLLALHADAARAAGGDVDLVSLRDASVALAHEVAETGSCLFASSPDVETEFVTRARTRFFDFEPFRREQWRLAGERLEERRRGP